LIIGIEWKEEKMILFEYEVEKIVEENKRRLIQYLLDIVSPVMENFPQFVLEGEELSHTCTESEGPDDTIVVYYKWERKDEGLNDFEVWFYMPLTVESEYHTERGLTLQMDLDVVEEGEDVLDEKRETDSFYFENREFFDVDRGVPIRELLSRFVEGRDLYGRDKERRDEDEDWDNPSVLHA
jgi:hypothetical protein